MIRAIDHLVLPVASLTAARTRYEALGFAVNPIGVHPFGTANCCVFLADGTYLELLAIHDPARIAEVISVNAFVAMDRRFRQSAGPEGLSAVALQSHDPDADELAFAAAGRGGQNRLAFTRKAVHPDGAEDTLSVDGAFCIDPGVPSLGFFTCHWRSAPEVVARIKKPGAHRNAVAALGTVWIVADEPRAVKPYLEVALSGRLDELPGGFRLRLQNADIALIDGDEFRAMTESVLPFAPVAGAAVTFVSSDMAITRQCLEQAGIDYHTRQGRLIIAPVPGQATTILIEEQQGH